MTKCLVLGGNGLVGSCLVESLMDHGCFVRAVSRSRRPQNLVGVKDKIDYVSCDLIKENGKLERAMCGIDILFLYHSFSTPISTVKDPVKEITINVAQTLKILDMARQQRIKKIVFPSSGGTIYGNVIGKAKESSPTQPISPYGISKLTIEKYLSYYKRLHGIRYKILRYSNIYGERQNATTKHGVIPIFLTRVKNHQKIELFGDGSAVRDYIYVKDAIDATMLVVFKKSKFDIYNIGSGEGYSIRQIIEIISKVTKERIKVIHRPQIKNFVDTIILDNQRIYKEFGWRRATTLNEGIKKMWRSLK